MSDNGKEKITADALAKAALQATARALHTAQLAADAYAKIDDAARLENRDAMAGLRDALLDAYGKIEDAARQRMLSCRATITSDELIDLLALCVRG